MANASDAAVCRHCNAPLSHVTGGSPTTRRVEKNIVLTGGISEKITETISPPPEGMLFFLLNRSEPIGLCVEKEFILGRSKVSESGPVFDLSEFDAYAMGVSRNHASVKAAEGKYILTDLNSANGTWIDGERILPSKPHDLSSGSALQLGRLKLIVIFSTPAEPKKE
jgi:pSer/pThr/pTyr-binding forkhead associated (FHA) protein